MVAYIEGLVQRSIMILVEDMAYDCCSIPYVDLVRWCPEIDASRLRRRDEIATSLAKSFGPYS